MPPKAVKTHKGRGWKIQVGDCARLIPRWQERPVFIFADPPFNINQDYKGYVDKKPTRFYESLTESWITKCAKALDSHGVLAVHCSDELVKMVLQHASPLTRIAWIIWHYRFGQCSRNNWIRSKCHCLIFAKDPQNYVFHPPLVSSDRATVYQDPRTKDSSTPGERVPFDVWGIPSDGPYWGRVQGNSKERRRGHPNQLPEVYLQRLIAAYTNPGDLVADPFVGSGTTPTVAVGMGRRFIGCEISPWSARNAARRVWKGPVRL